MTTRRRFLATSGAMLTTPAILHRARAATPKTIAVIVKQIDDIVSFDPAEAYEFSNNEIDANCYNRLVSPDSQDGRRVVGDLAESWDVTSDGKRFTFHLRSGPQFETGRAVSGDDVAFSLQRVVRLNKTPAFILTQFGFSPDNVAAAITAPDARTVVLELPQPAAPSFVLNCLSANVGSVVDRQVVMAHAAGNDMGNDWLKTRTAGSGAYKLTEYQPSDHAILDANPHGDRRDIMRRIVIRHVAEPSAQLLLLKRGDADIARDLTPDQLRGLAGNADFSVQTSAQARSMYIAMNQANETLRKPEVIAAIKWAIDYDAIAANITPRLWDVCQSFLPSSLPGAITTKPYRFDPERAKALLAKAGLAGGFAITLDHIAAQPSSDIAQAVQASLAAIGIKAELRPGEQKQVITKTRARQHQLAMLEWGSDYFDPNSNAQGFCENPDDGDGSALKIIAWRSHFVDAELTRDSRAAARELDDTRRIGMYQDLQRGFMERAPFAMMLQKNAVAVLRRGVTGLRVGALPDYTRYTDISKT